MGDVSLTFSRISLLNIKMLNGVDAGDTTASVVWFATTGNVSITGWSNDGTVAPDLTGLGAIGFDSTGSTQQNIWMHDINVKCAPLCFSMFGDANSVTFENSNFVSDIPVATREAKAFSTSTGVWVNSTGNLQVINCQFKGFGTDYGALSVFATNITVTNCSFDDNMALTSGAGLSVWCRHLCVVCVLTDSQRNSAGISRHDVCYALVQVSTSQELETGSHWAPLQICLRVTTHKTRLKVCICQCI